MRFACQKDEICYNKPIPPSGRESTPVESITPVGKRPDPLTEAGRSGAFPGSLRYESPVHTAVSTALVSKLANVPWLLNLGLYGFAIFLVLEPSDVPWLLNQVEERADACFVLEPSDVPWLLNRTSASSPRPSVSEPDDASRLLNSTRGYLSLSSVLKAPQTPWSLNEGRR